MVNVGESRKCPECENTGTVVWISQDRKTMGVQCRRSHGESSTSVSKFGGTIIHTTKTRKNVVFMTAVSG